MPGPIPKRSDQRRRRNKPADGVATTKAASGKKVAAPRVSANWHPLMKDWFRSLKESGQAVFYEPSDWQTARLLAHVMSEELNSGKPVKATILSEFNQAATSLMTTEGARRRLRLELQQSDSGVADDGTVSILEHYRQEFAG